MSKRIWTNGQFNQTKEFGRIMCHYLLMNIYHIKENVLHLWELYVGFQNLVQEKNKTHVDLSFGLQFMIEIIHDWSWEKKSLLISYYLPYVCLDNYLHRNYFVFASQTFHFFSKCAPIFVEVFWKNMKWFSLDKCRLVRGIASLPMLKCVALLCQMLVRYFSNQYVSFLMWMVCT